MSDQSSLSRRELFKAGGCLVVSFGLAELAGKLGVEEKVSAQAVGTLVGRPSRDVDGWISIGADGRVTAYTGKCELGQGLYTAQTQLVAEELGVAIERVHLIQSITGTTPDQGVTSGAQSHPQNFNHINLALAGATAREALFGLASKQLGVAVDQLTVKDGVVSAKSDPSRNVSYAQLIGGKKFNLTLSSTAKRRHPSEWTVLGTPVKRLDIPAIATGEFEYVHNVKVPGMAHGRMVRPPTVGATLESVDESSVSKLPGFVKLVVKKNFVGVVFEKQYQAVQGVRALKAVWKPGPALPAQREFHETMRKMPSRDTLLVDSGDVDARLKEAAQVIRATYKHPYQMHASVGAACAVADVKGEAATIWSPTQGVYPQRDSCAMVLGLRPENVKVIFSRGSGCYGINGADTVSYDAALLSQACGRPVRVQLTKHDELANENYGPAFVIDQRVGLDKDGTIVAWDYEAWSLTRGGRPGYDRPGNQMTGFLAGFDPLPFVPRQPAPAPTAAYANGSNIAPSYVSGCAGGVCGGTGMVKSERMLSHLLESPFWTGPLRAPNRLQNTFAHECLMDEIAAKVGADPVEYRLRHLRDPRFIGVVRATAKTAGWTPRPSPQPRTSRTGIVSGRGFASVLYEGDNGYIAIAVDVDVNQDTGEVLVKRMVTAIDCGPVSNPDGVKNQAEGGALHGMSRALFEQVTWDQEKVTSVDWRTYRTVPVGSKVPRIETVLINTHDAEANGAGETAITVVAPAIGNAIFDATGVRIREIPFTPERVKAQLAL